MNFNAWEKSTTLLVLSIKNRGERPLRSNNQLVKISPDLSEPSPNFPK